MTEEQVDPAAIKAVQDAKRREPSDPPDDGPWDPSDSDAPDAPKAKPTEVAKEDEFKLLSVADLLSATFDRMAKPRQSRGCPTGNTELDAAIGGFRRGNVTILGAKRSFGKTSFSIMVAEETMKAGKCCLLVAGEDSEQMYGARFMARRANIPATRLRDMEWESEHEHSIDLQKATAAIHEAPRVPFFVRSAGRPAEWVAKAIREAAKHVDVELVVVDYLQCIRAQRRQQDRRCEVTYVARIIVDAIKEINAAGLLLSQLKRTEHDRPEIEDLKESGDLEDMSEHVLLGWRKQDTKNQDAPDERVIVLAKNKDGNDEVNDITCPFDTVTASFRSTYGFDGMTRGEFGSVWDKAQQDASDDQPSHWSDR